MACCRSQNLKSIKLKNMIDKISSFIIVEAVKLVDFDLKEEGKKQSEEVLTPKGSN